MRSDKNFKHTWGIRFSVVDAAALLAFGTLSGGLYYVGSPLWWLVVIAAGHFFLFCNVFRIARSRELIWAGLFLLNAGFWVLLGRLDWFNVLACQLPASVGVLAWEIRAPSYHGVFADRLNPALLEYLENKPNENQ